MEIGLLMLSEPGRAQEIARRAEAAGFAHLAFGDTQNIGPEAWGQLLLAAGASSRIRLGTGVTNPVTRDTALLASAALALQVESGGRAFVGIGRGDSALAKIGRRPEPLDAFERYVVDLRAYLSGEKVRRGSAECRIEWFPSELPRVPVEVAATGPRAIELAGRCADGVSFCLGADPDVLARALESVRRAARAAGRDPDALRTGAFVNCVVDDDVAAARDLARGGVSVFARFAGWSQGGEGIEPEAHRAAARGLRATYAMERHAQAAGGRSLADSFLDSFAIVGPAEHAVERLRKLASVGLDSVTIAPGSAGMGWEQGWRSIEAIGRDVIPSVG